MSFDPDEPGPGLDRPVAHLAWQLREQARACAATGSPLYARLLWSAADDVDRCGPTYDVLRPHLAPGRGGALALRFMAAVHHLVLQGRARQLAAHYPSAGGDASDGDAAVTAFHDVVAAYAGELVDLVAAPCQTNEVGRAAAVAGGVLGLVGERGGPLRLLEVGSAAGLLLRWDAFAYGDAAHRWGPRDSPVNLVGLWAEPPPWPLPATAAVVERRGCDRDPIDATSDAAALGLAASVWADQPARHRRLHGALSLARSMPVRVDQAGAAEWAAAMLAEPASGAVTVLWHTVVWEYLAVGERDRFARAVTDAGARATRHAPLVWARLEPVTALRRHALTVTTWPGGHERVLATSGAHGDGVRWHAGPLHAGPLVE